MLLALLLSGAASLMYQVAWTRRLIAVTSATAGAQALILAVFMAGLALGAYLAGRFAARTRRPLVAYAAVETGAAALALGAFPILHFSDHVRDAAVRFGASPSLALGIQLALASVYLLSPTTLMGASLPLVIEHGARARAARPPGSFIAALYCVNTVGATLGCLGSGFVAIERFGLVRTAAIGAGLAIVAAAIAALQGWRAGEVTALPPAEKPASGASLDPLLLLAAAGAGAIGLAAEVVWTRLFSLVMPNTVYALTQVLAAVLVGIALGSALAGLATQRDAPARAVVLAAVAAALGAALLAVVPRVVVDRADAFVAQSDFASGRSLSAAVTLLACVVPASAAVAAVLPLLAAASRGDAARAFGAQYAANVLGGIAGSLAAGFILLPRLGVDRTGTSLEIAALAVSALLVLRGPRRPIAALAPIGAAAVCAFLGGGPSLPGALYDPRLPAGTTILEVREGAASNVMVTENAYAKGERRLWINANWVASSRGPHRAFAHLPALLAAAPRRVLGIALGTGQTFAAALEHGAERLDCVEIDDGVVAMSRRWFGVESSNLLEDPRVFVHVEDGRSFLRTTRDAYDYIVLEPLQAWSVGTSSLYSREFYEEAHRVLARGGVLSQWIPLYGQRPAETRAMLRAGLDVFENGILWLAGRDGVVAFSDAPLGLPLATLDERLRARGVAPDPKRLPIRSAADLLPFVLLGPAGLRRFVAGAERLEDDRPFLEFRAAASLSRQNDWFPDNLRAAAEAMDDLRPILSETAGVSTARLDALLELRRAFVDVAMLPEEDRAGRLRLLHALSEEAKSAPAWRVREAAIRATASGS